MATIDLSILLLVVGATAALLFRFAATRLPLGRHLPASLLMSLPALFGLAIVITLAIYVFLIDFSTSVVDAPEGKEVTLFGRVVEVAVAPHASQASVYRLEDPSGRVEIASETYPPRQGAFAVIRGRVIEHAGQRMVWADRRFSTF